MQGLTQKTTTNNPCLDVHRSRKKKHATTKKRNGNRRAQSLTENNRHKQTENNRRKHKENKQTERVTGEKMVINLRKIVRNNIFAFKTKGGLSNSHFWAPKCRL